MARVCTSQYRIETAEWTELVSGKKAYLTCAIKKFGLSPKSKDISNRDAVLNFHQDPSTAVYSVRLATITSFITLSIYLCVRRNQQVRRTVSYV